MNPWARNLKSIYRREPIASFVLIAGVTNVAMGGFSEHWSLMAVGLGTVGTVGVAIALQWWQLQKRKPMKSADRLPVYALPPSATDSGLPLLTIPKKNPPR